MPKITCIIPTYNEEKRIDNVLGIIATHPMIDEVIVVDDGSNDKTTEVVSKYPNVRLIVHEKNKGKSGAVWTGFKAARGDYIMFIDADLIGLTKDNITHLIEPIIAEKADVSISLRKNSPWFWHVLGIDYISGERVFKKDILNKHIDEILTLPKFGLESFFNKLIIKNGHRISVVKWNNVESPFKYKKVGLYKGIKGDVLMILDIFRTISIWGPPYQIWKMRELMVPVEEDKNINL